MAHMNLWKISYWACSCGKLCVKTWWQKILATNFSSFCWSQTEEVLKQQKTTRDDRKLSPFCEREEKKNFFSSLYYAIIFYYDSRMYGVIKVVVLCLYVRCDVLLWVLDNEWEIIMMKRLLRIFFECLMGFEGLNPRIWIKVLIFIEIA